jgi:hypothetical protein
MSDQINFGGSEPLVHIEDDGLEIKAYEVGDRLVLDFDWKPGSRWSFLGDEEMFLQFAVNWLEEMTGEPMTEEEIKELRVTRDELSSGENQATDEQSETTQGAGES